MEWDYVKETEQGKIFAKREIIAFDEVARVLLVNGQDKIALYVNSNMHDQVHALVDAIYNLRGVTRRITTDRITIITCSNDMYEAGFLETMMIHIDNMVNVEKNAGMAKWGIAPDINQALDTARKEINDLAR